MKKHLFPFVLTLLLVLPAAPLLCAQEKAEHKEPETELGKVMEKVNGAWRKVRKQVADPASNASTLELVATIAAGLEKALTYTPIRAEDVPAADREKYIESFRTKMKEFMGQVSKLEAALKADDNATAQALVQKMGTMQREDHKEFRRPEM
jgi:cytochrome c556